MNRLELILRMSAAIRLYESAVATGDNVSMDIAQLTIEECKRKLGIKDEAKTH